MARSGFILLYLNFLLFGGIATTLGATLPLVIRTLEWSYLTAGVVMATNAAGYFCLTFLTGLVIQRWGAHRLMLAGLLLQTAGIGFFGITPHLAFNLFMFLLLGAGQGIIEVVSNFLVAHLEPDGRSRLMNLMHSAFTVGAVLAPFGAGLMVHWQLPWRSVYAAMGLASLAMLLVFVGRKVDLAQPVPVRERFRQFRQLPNQALLWFLALAIFLYVGAEIGISSWIAEYYVKVYSIAPEGSALMVSLFWLGILMGRLLASWLYRGNQPALLLAWLGGLSGLALTCALLLSSPAGAAAAFFATGLGYSTVYPMCMTIAGKHFAEHKGLAIGLVSTAGGMGVCLFPFVMSAISNAQGILAGFWFYWLLTVALAAATATILLLTRRAT